MARDWNDVVRESGIDKAREMFDAAKPLQANATGNGTQRQDWRELITTAAKLQAIDFPPITYVVPGIIPEGLTILAGRPKIGKSWLALDICIAGSGDRFCLGNRRPVQGDVLYIALEDNPRRLRRRIDKLITRQFAEPWPARLNLATRWPRLDRGGTDDIRRWIESASAPRLVILDTLAGVRPIRTREGYTEDYETLATLHDLANESGIAIIVLHHTRKMEADDPVDTISGTLGLAGCADTLLILARSSKGSSLYIRGRDVEEAEHAISFSRETCRWTILGNADDVQRSEARSRILTALDDGTPMAVDVIVSATGQPRSNVEKLLHFMVKDGEVERVSRGVYARAGKNGKTESSDLEMADSGPK